MAQGVLRPTASSRRAEVLAKHDENYMPQEVADALKQAGYWNEQRRQRGKAAMIAELGHFALVLALGWRSSRARCRSGARRAATRR